MIPKYQLKIIDTNKKAAIASISGAMFMNGKILGSCFFSATAVSFFREVGTSQEMQTAQIVDTNGSFKLLAKNLEELK